MKRLSRLLAAAALTTLLGNGGALAQEGPPTFAPFEIYGCAFREGNDMDDLRPVIDNWTEWADEMGVEDYSAIMAVPFFHNAQFPYDFLWLGIYADSAAMGNGLHRWVNQSGDLQGQFAEVVDCSTHMGLAAAILKAPTGEGDGVEDGGAFITEFTNCTVREGRTRAEAAGAIRQWINYLTANGSNSSHALLIPGPGEAGDAAYSFKWMTSISSWVSAAKEFDIAFNNGGVARRTELFGRVMNYDSPRIYNSSFIREAGG